MDLTGAWGDHLMGELPALADRTRKDNEAPRVSDSAKVSRWWAVGLGLTPEVQLQTSPCGPRSWQHEQGPLDTGQQGPQWGPSTALRHNHPTQALSTAPRHDHASQALSTALRHAPPTQADAGARSGQNMGPQGQAPHRYGDEHSQPT